VEGVLRRDGDTSKKIQKFLKIKETFYKKFLCGCRAEPCVFKTKIINNNQYKTTEENKNERKITCYQS